MKKPTVYLDTNIISTLYYGGTDIDALSRRMVTRDWWESERHYFEIVASGLTEQELEAGVYQGQPKCLKFVRRLKYIPSNSVVRDLAHALIDAHVIPASKPADATHLALATSHDMDYLLTWNYSHLANPVTQLTGTVVAARFGLRLPLLVSPESIPKVAFGNTIRRPNHEG